MAKASFQNQEPPICEAYYCSMQQYRFIKIGSVMRRGILLFLIKSSSLKYKLIHNLHLEQNESQHMQTHFFILVVI
jgi:hypothetical protein